MEWVRVCPPGSHLTVSTYLEFGKCRLSIQWTKDTFSWNVIPFSAGKWFCSPIISMILKTIQLSWRSNLDSNLVMIFKDASCFFLFGNLSCTNFSVIIANICTLTLDSSVLAMTTIPFTVWSVKILGKRGHWLLGDMNFCRDFGAEENGVSSDSRAVLCNVAARATNWVNRTHPGFTAP